MPYNHDDIEGSVDLGSPVYLYRIRYGSDEGAVYRFTDAERDVVYDDEVYEAVPIRHDAVEASGKLDENELVIEVSRANPVAELLSLYPTSFVITLVIRVGHLVDSALPALTRSFPNDGVIPVAWTGRIVERVGGEKGKVKLVAIPSGVSMKRPGLTRHFQYSCPLALYGTRCNADKEAATTAGTIVSTTPNRIVLSPGWMVTDMTRLDYIGGMIEWDGPVGREYRLIVDVLPDDVTLVLSGPTSGLDAGDTVDVVLGCQHTLEACGRVHGNTVNYGGHPYIPAFNPVGKNPFD
jgi:hypothetical protein